MAKKNLDLFCLRSPVQKPSPFLPRTIILTVPQIGFVLKF